MKEFIGYTLLTLILVSCGAESGHFRIKGRLRNFNQGEFFVYSIDGGIPALDTIRVNQGRFEYDTRIEDPATFVIIFPNFSELPVFGESGATATIEGDASHLKEIEVSGTNNNEDMTKWREMANRLTPPEVKKEAEKYIKDSTVLERAKEMSKLQPERMGEAVLTKQQLIDSYNKAEINDPKMLKKLFEEFTGGASSSEYKYVSNKKLYKLKKEMIDYVNTICKAAKDGKVDKALLDKVQKKNLMYNGLNFAAGFAVAAAFLSTFIPKFQYYVTRKTTGVDAFPGVYDFEHHQEEID